MDQQSSRLLNAKEVQTRTSWSRATLWRRVKGKEFPAPVRIGANRVAWLETTVTRWIESLACAPAEGAKSGAADPFGKEGRDA